MAGATADAAYRLTLVANIRDVVKQLLKLSKKRMAARSTRTAPIFQPEDLVYLLTKGLHIRSQKCTHHRDQKFGPYKNVSKVCINSYNMLLPTGCRLHPVFHWDLLSHATLSISLLSLQDKRLKVIVTANLPQLNDPKMISLGTIVMVMLIQQYCQ